MFFFFIFKTLNEFECFDLINLYVVKIEWKNEI